MSLHKTVPIALKLSKHVFMNSVSRGVCIPSVILFYGIAPSALFFLAHVSTAKNFRKTGAVETNTGRIIVYVSCSFI